MKKLFVFLLVFALITVLSIHFIGAQIANVSIGPKIDRATLNHVNVEGRVKVILTFKENKTLVEQRGKVISKLGNEKRNVKYLAKNSIVVEINKSDMDYLKLDSSIKRISYDYPVKAFLQDAVGIINASSVWPVEIQNLNLTGINQTICIIDTGVNYTHRDLGGCYGNNTNMNCKVIGGYDFVNGDSNPMDDDGHGTEVAGIAAANGTITGAAPGAKIIAIKSLDNNGDGTLSDIVNGIYWCVDNSSLFNIGVISMSLGTVNDLYSSYCDSTFPEFADAINAAIAKNITVVAASGNSGSVPRSTTSISAPACIENATAISATNKDDSIASYSHYSSIVKLFAPGTSINSTAINGRYIIDSGTSMATPLAAGAFALIREYLNLTSRTKTPREIESVLNSTGKRITDGESNFSRINVYDAIASLDIYLPNVSLDIPTNSTVTVSRDTTFRCNATDDLLLRNMTFYLWNLSSIYSSQSVNITGQSYSFEKNVTNMDYNDYHWNCIFTDHNGISSSNSNYSLSVIYDVTPPLIVINSPTNGSWNKGVFNVSINETGFCIYSLNTNNYSMQTSDNRSFYAVNNSLLQDSWNNLTYYCNDSFGNGNFSSLTFRYDATKPNVTLTEPYPADETSNSVGEVFYYNVSDNLNLTRCDLILNNVSVSANSSAIVAENQSNNFSYVLTPGTYNWVINCTDEAGNIGTSDSRSITISSVQDSPSGGSPGGGSGGGAKFVASKVNFLTSADVINGKTVEVSKGDSIVFPDYVSNNFLNFTLKIENLTVNGVNITLKNSSIFMISGQDRKINLTNSAYYDFELILGGISGNRVNFTVKRINEPIEKLQGLQNQVSANGLNADNRVGQGNQGSPIAKMTSRDLTRMILLLCLGVVLIGIAICLAIRMSFVKKKVIYKYFS